MWYRMSNRKRNFVSQIANRENRTRYYTELSKELENTQPPPLPQTVNDEDAPNDPTKHYEIPKTTSVVRDLMEFVVEHRDDRALRVSLRVPRPDSPYSYTLSIRTFDIACLIIF